MSKKKFSSFCKLRKLESYSVNVPKCVYNSAIKKTDTVVGNSYTDYIKHSVRYIQDTIFWSAFRRQFERSASRHTVLRLHCTVEVNASF